MDEVEHRPAPAAVAQYVAPCKLHAYHSPISVINEMHHVFPLYLQRRKFGVMAGEEPDQETWSICSTSHNTVHYALDIFLRTEDWPVWCVGKTRDLCEEAVQRFRA